MTTHARPSSGWPPSTLFEQEGTRPGTASPSLRLAIGTAFAGMPLLVPTGPGNTSPADLPIVLAMLGVLLWLSSKGIRLRLPYSAAVWLLMLAGAVACLANTEVRSTAVLGQDLFLLLWAAAIASAIQSDASLVPLMCRAWCWSGAGWASLLVVGRLAGISWLAGQTARDGTRAALTFGDPNLAGNYFVAALFLILASRHPRRAWVRTVAVVIIVVAIVFTGSNGAMVGLVTGTGVALVMGTLRSRGAIAATGLACVMVLGLGFLGTTINLTALQEQAAGGGPVLHDSFGRSDASSQDRKVLFVEGVQLFWSGNLLGVGPGRTRATLAAIPAPYVKEAHNDYVATLVELGALGGVGLIVLLASATMRLRRIVGFGANRDGRPSVGDLPAPHYLVAIGVSYLVSGAFYEVLHFRHVWAFLGLVAGMDLIRGEHVGKSAVQAVSPGLPGVPGPLVAVPITASPARRRR